MRVEERTTKIQKHSEILRQQAALLEETHEAIFVRSIVESRVTFWNRGAEKTYGWTKEEALGKITHSLLQTRFPEPLEMLMRKVLQKGQWNGELVHTRRDGAEIVVDSRWALHSDLSGKPTGILEININITERKHAEEALRVSEQKHRKLMETANDAIFVADGQKGIILDANKRAEALIGLSREEIIGMPYVQLFPPEDAEEYPVRLQQRPQGESTFKNGFVWHKGGRRIPVEISTSVVQIEGKTMLHGIFRDTTERKRAEEQINNYQGQLRALTSELALVEERERRRLAAEVHDHIGQTLALVKMKLGDLCKFNPCPDLASPLAQICNLIDKTIQETRSLIFEISPPVLYELGFVPAVEWLAEHFQEQYGISVDLKIDRKPKPLGEDLRVLLFQAIRELLINIAKHAKASRVRILMERVKTDLRIILEDDGVGFASPAHEDYGTTKGFGLFNIRERMHHLGTKIEIETSPGEGTKVILVVPLISGAKRPKRSRDGAEGSAGR